MLPYDGGASLSRVGCIGSDRAALLRARSSPARSSCISTCPCSVGQPADRTDVIRFASKRSGGRKGGYVFFGLFCSKANAFYDRSFNIYDDHGAGF